MTVPPARSRSSSNRDATTTVDSRAMPVETEARWPCPGHHDATRSEAQRHRPGARRRHRRSLDRLDDDPELWVGVLTGTPSVFSAGTDLASAGGGSPTTDRGGEYGVIRRNRTKPLIAAVEGPALGGGFEIVLACDLVVAARDASFGLPEVKRGLVPTCGGLFRTSRALPLNVAKEMLLTGDRLMPDRALRPRSGQRGQRAGRRGRRRSRARRSHLRRRPGRGTCQSARCSRRPWPSGTTWAGRPPPPRPTRSHAVTT